MEINPHLSPLLLSLQAINSYFQAIVDEVTAHGGDILKFAGDAIFAEWRANEIEQNTAYGERTRMCLSSKHSAFQKVIKSLGGGTAKNRDELEECVHTAAVCGAMIVNKCADYPIYAKTVSGAQGEEVAKLNVHCGLGVGDMVGVHVGNDYNRREYLVFGDPIDQVAEACDSAKLGEIRASTEALKHLNRTQSSKQMVKCKHRADKSAIIASGKCVFFGKRVKKIRCMTRKHELVTSETSLAIPYDTLDTTSLKFFHKLLSFYVHPVVVEEEAIEHSGQSKRSSIVNTGLQNDTGALRGSGRGSGISINNATRSSLLRHSGQGVDGWRRASTVSHSISRRTSVISTEQERLRSDAELRSVFTIFIMPKIEAKLTDDPEANRKTFKLLNDIMNIVTSILDHYKGHLRQYIVDDKGEFRVRR